MTTRTSPGRPNVFTDDALLDAAVAVFSSAGYDGAHMSAIAEAAGTTKPTLYARLGSKDEIYVRAIEREAGLLRDALLSSYELGAGASAHESITIGTAALLDFCEQRTAGFRLLFDSAIGGPAVDRDDLVRRETREGVAALIRGHRAERGLPDGPEVDLIASIIGAIGIDAALYSIKHDGIDLRIARRTGDAILRSFLTSPDPVAWPQ